MMISTNWRERLTVARYHWSLTWACAKGALWSFMFRPHRKAQLCAHPENYVKVIAVRRYDRVDAWAYCSRCNKTLARTELRILEWLDK